MSSKVKVGLYAVINVVGNMITFGAVPLEYKLWVLLGFNLLQSIYMFYDSTYVYQKLGRKLGRAVRNINDIVSL
jgi:hypothetical protein